MVYMYTYIHIAKSVVPYIKSPYTKIAYMIISSSYITTLQSSNILLCLFRERERERANTRFFSPGKMDESSSIPAEKVIGAERRELQGLLKSAVQSVGWTYSLFWQLCPQQRFSFFHPSHTIYKPIIYLFSM